MAEKKQSEKIERTYNVPLRRGFATTPRYERTTKAASVLRKFLQRHMKCEDVKLGKHLNEELWKHGIKNPPHHIKITVVKEDEVAKAELFGHKYVDFKKQEKKKDESLKDKLMSKMDSSEEKKEENKEEKDSPDSKKGDSKPSEEN
ncbi:MAG: 50S ribosomal protein L31e [Candidatus Woesearchaeota archaeon]